MPSDGISCGGTSRLSSGPPSSRAAHSPSSAMTDRSLSTQVFQILLSLADQDLHGYAIIQDVAERTDGEVRLTASTLYAAVKRLLDQGLIDEVSSRTRDDDPRRRYYHL